MTSIGLHYIQESFYEPPQYKLAENDSYDGRCGEIFITLNRLLVFHCSICDKKYGELTDYIEHLSAQHYSLDQDNVAETEEDILTADTELHAEEEHNSSTSLDEESLNTEQKFDDDDNYELFDTASSDVEVDIKPDVDHVEEEYLLEVADNEDSLKLVNAANAGSVVPDAVRKKQDIKDHDMSLENYTALLLPSAGIITRSQLKKPTDNCSPKRFVCNSCKKSFSTMSRWIQHMETHSKERKLKFNSHTTKPFACGSCEMSFSTSRNWVHHTLSHYKELKSKCNSSLPTMFACDICAKTFATKAKLHYHSEIHAEERKFKCNVCDAAFKQKSNLYGHMRRHNNDEKRYSCEKCTKKFFTRTEFRKHERTHTGEKAYVCSYCGISFATIGSLGSHTQRRHHNLRPHKCELCEKRFYSASELKNHMVVHTNERSIVCAICSASFGRRKALVQHMKLHANAREYKCNMCEKSFNQRPALLSHFKINHKVVDSSKYESWF